MNFGVIGAPSIFRLTHYYFPSRTQKRGRRNACVSKTNHEYHAIDPCLREHQFLFSSSAVVSQSCVVCRCVRACYVYLTPLSTSPPTGAADPGLLPCCPCAVCICFAHRYQRSAPSPSRLFCRGNEGRCNVSNILNFLCAPLCSGRLNHPSHWILSPAFPSCALLIRFPAR